MKNGLGLTACAHFTSAVGRTLALDLLEYDPSTGRVEAWVGIPRLERAGDTVAVLRYGSPEGVGRDAESVWDRNHKLVRHP